MDAFGSWFCFTFHFTTREEFLTAMCALEQSDQEISAKLFVNVYDLDNDGFIGREDLKQMFLASSMLGGEFVASVSLCQSVFVFTSLQHASLTSPDLPCHI